MGTSVKTIGHGYDTTISLEDLGLKYKEEDYCVIPDGTDEITPNNVRGDPVLVVVPSSVRTIDDAMFYGHKRLKKIVCLEGSRLDLVGADCFRKSGLEDIEFIGPKIEIR